MKILPATPLVHLSGAFLLAWSTSAGAATYTFGATLSGPAESPPVTSPAFGSASVSFDDVLNQVTVQESWTGLIGGPASASHIHCCTGSALAGTAPVFLGFTGFPSLASGSYTSTFLLAPADFSTLIAGTFAGKSYVNIHNVAYPGGEIRGFLTQVAPVPEPDAFALLALGGLAMAWRLRRAHGRPD